MTAPSNVASPPITFRQNSGTSMPSPLSGVERQISCSLNRSISIRYVWALLACARATSLLPDPRRVSPVWPCRCQAEHSGRPVEDFERGRRVPGEVVRPASTLFSMHALCERRVSHLRGLTLPHDSAGCSPRVLCFSASTRQHYVAKLLWQWRCAGCYTTTRHPRVADDGARGCWFAAQWLPC